MQRWPGFGYDFATTKKYENRAFYNLVTQWFPAFAPHLITAVTLPARIVLLTPRSFNADFQGWPLGWCLEPLPHGNATSVDVRLSDDPSDGDELLQAMPDKLRSLRSQARGWIFSQFHNTSFEDIVRDDPVTQLVYHWLWDDLKHVAWVEGNLGYAR